MKKSIIQLGNAPPSAGENISANNPFDDPQPRPAPFQQSAPFPPVSRPQGTAINHLFRWQIDRFRCL